MVERPDPNLAGVGPLRQVGSQDAVVDDVDEGADAVPAFVIEPDLERKDGSLSRPQPAAAWTSSLTFTLFLVSKPLMKPDKLWRNRSAAAP